MAAIIKLKRRNPGYEVFFEFGFSDIVNIACNDHAASQNLAKLLNCDAKHLETASNFRGQCMILFVNSVLGHHVVTGRIEL